VGYIVLDETRVLVFVDICSLIFIKGKKSVYDTIMTSWIKTISTAHGTAQAPSTSTSLSRFTSGSGDGGGGGSWPCWGAGRLAS
jgi:hypothetical protein